MKIRFPDLILLVLLSFCGIVNGQDSNLKFSPQQLKEDLGIFRSNLETVQPGLYQYFERDSLDQVFSDIEGGIKEPMTSIEFYQSLLPLNKYIANGHTSILPSSSYGQALRTSIKRFPFNLYRDKGTVYILRNLSDDEKIQQKHILRSVNGLDIDQILKRLISNLPRDGYNLSLPEWNAVHRFRTHYALQFGTPDEYDLDLTDENGDKYKLKVSGKTYEVITQARLERYPDLPKPWEEQGIKPYTLDINDSIGIMTLRTFGVSEIKAYGQDFKDFFAASFKKLNENKIRKLVLDLRGNGGGDPEPTIYLFAHLYEKEFKFYEDMFTNVNRLPNPKYYNGNKFLFNLIAPFRLRKKGDNRYQAKYLKKTSKRPTVTDVYRGMLYVLIDPRSYSATGEMTGIIKSYDRGTFIGEEAGGNPVTNTSGIMEILELPNTKVRAIICLVDYVMAVDITNDGRGVIPDYNVRNSIDEEINHEDRVMKFALDLAKKE